MTWVLFFVFAPSTIQPEGIKKCINLFIYLNGDTIFLALSSTNMQIIA